MMKLRRHSVGMAVILALAVLATGCLPARSVAGDGGQPTPSVTIDLDGTRWNVVELNGEPVTGDAQGTLDFADGMVTGTAFCNGFGGAYELDGTELTFGDLAQTLMACLEPEGVMELESAYMAALSEAAGYRVDGADLVVVDAEGGALVKLSPAEVVGLEGTPWQLTGYNDGRGVTSLVLDTEISATFDDGTLSGTAGCNQYTAPYTLEDGTLSVGPAASTRMACMDPEGVMAQETAYLEALSDVASYDMGRNWLRLLDGDGALLLMFIVAGD
jgi:heat shock protein HslJ